MMDGRVKTLHPRLYAGLLALRDDDAHLQAASEHSIEPVDLVCVNLYPFEQTLARGDAGDAEIIENIDIGGPTMIRAAAKNSAFAAVVVDPEDYAPVLEQLRESGGLISLQTRTLLATKAFALTSRYDTAISTWFARRTYEGFPPTWRDAYEKVTDLRYGENPHQQAAFYARAGAPTHLLDGVTQLHGKELSFNNLLDLSSARELVEEFDTPACAIVKHNNPCGCALGETIQAAYERAFACDPLSAYGGVIALNRPVDRACARAPVRAVHRGPARARLRPRRPGGPAGQEERAPARAARLAGAQRTRSTPNRSSAVSSCRPATSSQRPAPTCARCPPRSPPRPSGRTSCSPGASAATCAPTRSSSPPAAPRSGSAPARPAASTPSRLAVEKARATQPELLAGSALASDAFFPFADGPQLAIDAGVGAIVQPGGSVRDEDVIAAVDAAGVAMVATGIRHFRH